MGSDVLLFLIAFSALAGCARLRVEPVQVDVSPIHVTVDVNVKVQKVDQALESFFSDVQAPAPGPAAPAKEQSPSKEAKP
ncbi:MAG: hypothetical protein JXQ75_24295 [Phycisphaerae bacterium]|nr:hypothetical protein [Phycisphaerae bacterium]